MKSYGRIRSSQRPPELEITDTNVFIASNIQAYEKTFEDTLVQGFEYDYTSYTKDEFLIQQNQKVNTLTEELNATKILLGVE